MSHPPDLLYAPRLGGKSAVAVFVAVLLAFVVETQLSQFLQTTLEYRQSYFIFYTVHSCFLLSLPIHLIYLLCTTKNGLRPLLRGLRFAIVRQLTTGSEEYADTRHRALPFARTAFLVVLLTIFSSLPGLLWFAAVPLASVTDITAIWNANAFFTYVFSVKLLGMNWGALRLLAVCLATLGVMTVVYGGTKASPPGPESATKSIAHQPAPFVGDILTLVASLVYAFYQVVYKKYIALPTDPDLTSQSANYQGLYSADDADDENQTPASLKDEIVYPPPFGLHPNLIITSIGMCTLLVFWMPIPFLHYYGLEEFRLPTRVDTLMAIAGIAASAVVFNAGTMILLGIWGPIVTSVGSLLTIVLTFFSDMLFGTVPLTFGGLMGTGMIVGAFALLVFDMS
ncbi:hypothetical protein PISMIDRAFT_27567 [Pisolithus microcarpus 441]|uniref:EamA domain-containing protein n=1 Tax=Pisolithus microcarpus 441 TaxID=765257 RepID=A0A0D0A9F9_9AGAM|nr:hypothetical protein PISMIDRAFT_27567 [Pisolithus microcarpus 441]